MFSHRRYLPGYPYAPNMGPYHQYWNGGEGRRMPQPAPQPYAPHWYGMQMGGQSFYHSQEPGHYSQLPMQTAWPQQGHSHGQDVAQILFGNPLQPQGEHSYGMQAQPVPPFQNMNPYPNQAFLPKQPTGFQSVINSFKSQDGNLDINKMIDTAGQMMSAVTQVSSMVKGLGGILKV